MLKNMLLMVLLGMLSATVSAQTEMIVQIEANGEVITAGEGGNPIAGVDTTDYALVFNYGWTGAVDLDPSSGAATARENYGPLRFVKPLARSSVLLRKALDQNQSIDLALRLFAPDGAGSVAEVYRIDLTNGRVVGIRPFSDAGSGQLLEEIRVAWQAIEFTDVQTATSHVVQFPNQP